MAFPKAAPANGSARTAGFTTWLSEKEPGLEEAFTRPKPLTFERLDPPVPESNYALETLYLLNRADEYYDEFRGKFILSLNLVWILTALLFPVATVVYFLYVVPSFLTLTSTHASPYIPQPNLSSVPGNQTLFNRLVGFSRKWALWIVFIPALRIEAQGGIKGYLVPSQSPTFLRNQMIASAEGKQVFSRAEAEYLHLKVLYHKAIEERRVALYHVTALPERPPNLDDHTAGERMDEYNEKSIFAARVKTWMDSAEAHMNEIDEVTKTQACMKATGYKGIADWAADAYGAYANLITAVSTVCFVGAGLTYSSIFSANRGNIGLMCWSFSLFIVGLVISITVQALLLWCSRLANYPFSTPKIWEFFVGVGVYSAVGSVVSAISLLVLTVYFLEFHPDAPTDSPGDGGSGAGGGGASGTGNPQDADLVFTTNPRPASIFAFGFLGSGVVMAIIVFTLFSTANGIKLFLWRRSLERQKTKKKTLADYV